MWVTCNVGPGWTIYGQMSLTINSLYIITAFKYLLMSFFIKLKKTLGLHHFKVVPSYVIFKCLFMFTDLYKYKAPAMEQCAGKVWQSNKAHKCQRKYFTGLSLFSRIERRNSWQDGPEVMLAIAVTLTCDSGSLRPCLRQQKTGGCVHMFHAFVFQEFSQQQIFHKSYTSFCCKQTQKRLKQWCVHMVPIFL